MIDQRRLADVNIKLIIDRFDNLDGRMSTMINSVDSRLREMEKRLTEKCIVCPIANDLGIKLDNLQWHIPKLWGAMWTFFMAVLIALGSLVMYLYEKVTI
jgi:hypothetical protein